MAALQIPKEDVPAFIAIAGFTDENFSLFQKSLAETPPALSRNRYLHSLSKRLPQDVLRTTSSIMRALFSLYGLKESQGISLPDLTDFLIESVKETPELSSKISGDKLSKFKERMTALLSLDGSVGVMIKAAELNGEHERTFCGSRILSDIRPVFLSNLDSVPAAFICHNLQIGFHDSQSDAHHDIYFSLDDEDLFQLKMTIERAQKKSIAMKGLLKNSKVTNIDV